MGFTWLNLTNAGPHFQIDISLYQNVIYGAGNPFSVVMWPLFFKDS